MPPQPKCLCGECQRCKQRKYTREVYYPANAERVREQANASRLRRLEKARQYDRERSADRAAALDVQKRRARAWVATNVRRGNIAREPCEVCGAAETEGHHDDYSKPRDIRWLCRTHHMALHRRVA